MRSFRRTPFGGYGVNYGGGGDGIELTREAGFCRLQNPVKTHCSMFKFSLAFRKQQNFNFQ